MRERCTKSIAGSPGASGGAMVGSTEADRAATAVRATVSAEDFMFAIPGGIVVFL
jgi:hypothetical protein